MTSELWALWATAIGTFAAALSAVGIALWQHRAQNAVERGRRHERASLILIEEANHQSVTIANLDATPVWNLRITKAECMLWDAKEGGAVGQASARAQPAQYEVVAPQERKTFTLPAWRDDYDGPALPPPHTREGQPSWDGPDVNFIYTDAFRTSWKREGHEPPLNIGGTPLPGTITAPHRLWRYVKRVSRARCMDIASGVRGNGFRRRTQNRKRRERVHRRLAARRAAREDQKGSL
ncbi:hypothetical protein [Streptomyces cahuitamycinicus]|uniref:Uncharacterized protein n=1 Tax=Streptomyces cahuitamycinicus TaxID=2070367 RepID=A0A2N8TSB4_9ACTN|nr:hypothetical protein [Streptomyces cahuitamycinicus]PNG21898.1 hypothetical protein C1J00_12380 [Streptomyces cahuitamycinicus]